MCGLRVLHIWHQHAVEDTRMATTHGGNHSPKGPVTILGYAYVGETLIARPNGIGDADGIDYDTATFQWLRDGQVIADATSRTYSVSLSDVGKQLSIRYTYMDFGGTLEVLTSDPEPAVPAAGTPLPEDNGPYNPLMILGDARVGEALTARPNAVTDTNGIDYGTASFQWLRDGEIIQNATAQSYHVTDADIGAEISVIYSYADLSGASKSLTSNPEPAVETPAPVEPEPAPPVDDSLLIGTSDADTLTASAGLKRISGQEDTDTAFFPGDQSHYTIILGPDGVSVADHRTFGLGTIALDDVELIDFGTEIDAFSGPINLDRFSSHTDLDRSDLEDIIELYIAYFNRAPDAIGLNFWGTAFTEGTSLEDMALLFADQVETREIYTQDTSNDDFAALVYNNVLGRTPDQAGLEFWARALDSEAVSRDQFILKVLQGARSDLKLDNGYEFAKQQMADRAFLESKVDLGAQFAVHRGMSDVDNASAVMALFDGSQNSLNEAVAAIDSYYQDALDPNTGEFLLQIVGVLDTPFDL